MAGLLSGVAGVALSFVLHLVEYQTFGYDHGMFLDGVRQAPRWRRVVGPALGGLLAGGGWWWIRRQRPVLTVNELVTGSSPRPALWRVNLDALLQVLVVGSGASIGREGAPRQMAALLTATAIEHRRISPAHRSVLIAAAAGAGLAAVYNTPIAGALFAVEITLRTRRMATLAMALAVSGIATGVLWSVHGTARAYHWPGTTPSWPTTLAWALIAIAPCAIVGERFSDLMSRARAKTTPATPWLIITIGAAGTLLGITAWWFPELFGNGKAIIDTIITGHGTIAVFLALLLLKPLATSMYLRAGATGGLITPALATGAALGAAAAVTTHALGLPLPTPTYAIIGAAGVLATTQKAPWFAAFFAWELTGPPLWVLPCVLLTAIGSHHLAAHRATTHAPPLTRPPKVSDSASSAPASTTTPPMPRAAAPSPDPKTAPRHSKTPCPSLGKSPEPDQSPVRTELP
ncbi:chloride channel protein [Allobranchiibius sp. GilTou73]|uniref:chloride channel protein n=1 Tax=Allobranchiibius sp. GilTou73 TaxID=2904523 RepID=UPI001F466D48|nr:chloride channel protein [Allobranchiibius sp. GilTou73]UIJ33749.1 chloride channel protein [Allobranchiibius sp. GilTou73]